MNEELMAAFSIDAIALGGVISLYYWAYTAMQLPLGVTMDRLGPRVFLCSASFLCAISCYIFGQAGNAFVAGIARFMMGMGSACGLIGTIKLGTIWLEPKHIAKVTSLTILFGTCGASIGGSPMRMLLQKCGLNLTMSILSVIGLIIGCILFVVIRNNPPVDHHDEIPDLYANRHPRMDILKIAKNPQAWIVALYGMLMYIPITSIGAAWGVSFVERACNTSDATAASIVSAMFFGAAIGSPVFALTSDIIASRKLPMIIGSITTSIIWASILYIDCISTKWMAALFFIAGVMYTAKCLTFASICEVMPRKMSGISISFINMVVMSAGVIINPVIGSLIHYHWNGAEIVNNIPLYSLADYKFALSLIPISLTISGIILLFMKETHPQNNIPKEYGSVIDTDIL